MKRVAAAVAAFVLWAAGLGVTAECQEASRISLPAGTKIGLAVTAPVWVRTTKAGDPLYAIVDFPVAVAGRVAIPAGTYVQGTIKAVTDPTRKSGRAEVDALFTKIIFANGYTIALSNSDASVVVAAPVAPDGSASNLPSAVETAAKLTIKVTIVNDLLLDNGTQFEMTLATSLTLDADQVASALPLSRGPVPGSFKSATLCRPTEGSPGTPGTSDTVIPGSPGTPDITIPGGPGMPDTVIPGTPATPPTVIPGSPGIPDTPGTTCPAAPVVTSSEPLTLGPAQAQSIAPAANQ